MCRCLVCVSLVMCFMMFILVFVDGCLVDMFIVICYGMFVFCCINFVLFVVGLVMFGLLYCV